MTLQDRIVLITGASRGIGRAIARTLAGRGAAVAVNFRSNEEAARSLVKEIEESGGRAVAVRADVSDPVEAAELVAETRHRLGGLHILVNNAGVSSDGLIYDVAPDAWLHVMKVNFGGAFHCTHAVAGHFMSQRDGVIVNISSVLGEGGWIGQSSYSASKGALNAFTRASAVEFARFGVRVNAVLGGVVPTALISDILDRQDGGRALRKIIPMRKFADVEEIAAVVAFLAGPEASYITGELVTVDGGMSAQLGTGRW
jgi:3-oxoacyl-[acyl-carrier protein] reductase